MMIQNFNKKMNQHIKRCFSTISNMTDSNQLISSIFKSRKVLLEQLDYLGYDVKDYAEGDFVPANFVPAESPFFPAATTTTTGDFLPSRIITRGDLSRQEALEKDIDKYGFVVEEPIGVETCERCHAATTAQWATSAHRFSSFNNPFYEATINDMRKNATTSNPEVAAHIAHYENLGGKEGKIKSKWCSRYFNKYYFLFRINIYIYFLYWTR